MSIRLFRACAAFVVFAGVLTLSATAQAQDPWSRLKAGDWAKYKSTPAPGMETHMKWVVKSAEGGKVVYTVEATTLMNGTAVAAPVTTELTYDASAAGTTTAPAAGDAAAPVQSEETVQVNGKDLKCKVTTVDAGGMKSTTWMSDDVPFGIVKVEAAGVVAQELVEWGSGS